MKKIGVSLGEASTGGGSDGNFTGAIGVPTLDGLGAIGDGAHTPHEHVVTSKLAERAALIAGLLATGYKRDNRSKYREKAALRASIPV